MLSNSAGSSGSGISNRPPGGNCGFFGRSFAPRAAAACHAERSAPGRVLLLALVRALGLSRHRPSPEIFDREQNPGRHDEHTA